MKTVITLATVPLKAALRRLADCAPETRMPVFRYPLLSKITIDLISAPASQTYNAERLFSVCGDLTAGKRNRMAKKLERRLFLRMNLKYFDNVNPVNACKCLILTADFNSGRYDSEHMMMMTMMTTTITSNSVSVLYTALLLLLVSNSK